MKIQFQILTTPTAEIAECFSKWENDPVLIPFTRPNKDRQALDARQAVTVPDLERRLEHHSIFLIYMDEQLVGEVDYQVDPNILYKKESGTAWIGIVIGEYSARGKGVGKLALQFLENEIKTRGLHRIELGVFEFNINAIQLYQGAGYREIARIPDFTFWHDKLWQDIRMEKYL